MLSCSFYLYRFRKYVPYGFPIINFCKPGVHYETPCILIRFCFGVKLPEDGGNDAETCRCKIRLYFYVKCAFVAIMH